MKKTLTLILALALLLGLAAPALADELPDCLIGSEMLRQFMQRLPDAIMAMGEANPATTLSKYALRGHELLDGAMRFSNDEGTVVLLAEGESGEFDPTAPADRLSFSIDASVNPIDAVALKTAFLGAVSDLDPSAVYEDLIAWMPEASQSGELSLSGYTLSYGRDDSGRQSLILATGASGEQAAPPAAELEPGTEPAQAAGLPECFVPQVAAGSFNALLHPVLEMLGAPDPDAVYDRFQLTRADVEGSVLYLSNAEGSFEMSAYFEDGEPAVDGQASTLGIAMVADVERSELLTLGATFLWVLSEADSSVTDLSGLLDWMSDAVDGGEGAIMPLNGYALVYAPGQNGHIFTLVPDE